jgi:branched-chain amino acid transport system ATP-binding protein
VTHIIQEAAVGGLVVRDVSVRFGGLAALQDVSFDVPPGSVVGIIGPNGAGKTTLFNVITGFVRPTTGTLTWEDGPLRPSPERLVKAGIARTLQAVGLFPRLSALENVMVGASRSRRAGFASALFALPRSDRDERRLRDDAMSWLDRLGVADAAHKPPTALPYPVQKQVALARALVSRPRLLLLDEPAGGLGSSDIAALASLIRELPSAEASPCSVLLVEHHMDLVMDVCDQVVVLDFGCRVALGTPDEVKADPAVASAYLGVDVPPDAQLRVAAGAPPPMTQEGGT